MTEPAQARASERYGPTGSSREFGYRIDAIGSRARAGPVHESGAGAHRLAASPFSARARQSDAKAPGLDAQHDSSAAEPSSTAIPTVPPRRSLDESVWRSAAELSSLFGTPNLRPPRRNAAATLGGQCWAMPFGIQIGLQCKGAPHLAQLQPHAGLAQPVWKYSFAARNLFYYYARTFPDVIKAIQAGTLVDASFASPLANCNEFVYGLSEQQARDVALWLTDLTGRPGELLDEPTISSAMYSFERMHGPMAMMSSASLKAPHDDPDGVWHELSKEPESGPRFEPSMFELATRSAPMHSLLGDYLDNERFSKSDSFALPFETAASPLRPRRPSLSGTADAASQQPFEASAELPSLARSTCSDSSSGRSCSPPARKAFAASERSAWLEAAELIGAPVPRPISRELWLAMYDEYLAHYVAGSPHSRTLARAAIAAAANDNSIDAFATATSIVPYSLKHTRQAMGLSSSSASLGSSAPNMDELVHGELSAAAARPLLDASASSSAAELAGAELAGAAAALAAAPSAEPPAESSPLVRQFCRNRFTRPLTQAVEAVLVRVALAAELSNGSTKSQIGVGFREVLKFARKNLLHSVLIASDIEPNTTEDLTKRLVTLTSECANLGLPYGFISTRARLAHVLGKSGAISCVGFIAVPELMPLLEAMAVQLRLAEQP